MIEAADGILTQCGYDRQHVEKILAVFRSRGGYCDREVMFNVFIPLVEELKGT